MAAVNKVVLLLEDLQKDVLAEGEKEASTYNKFACFCKDTSADKSKAITDGEDAKTTLAATIAELTTRREGLDSAIQQLEADISEAEKAMKTAAGQRAKALKAYRANEADLAGAIDALKGAISSLKASVPPTLAQLQAVAETVRTAALVADALSIGGASVRRTLGFFLQGAQVQVPMENYKFHSDDIISTLENLLKDFRTEKKGVDEAEVEAVAQHNAFMQLKTTLVKNKNTELDDAKKEKAQTQESVASNSQQLTTVAATLLDDQQYLTELSRICADKAATWDQRSKVRSEELSAITAAVGILKGAVGKATTAATIRFSQWGVSVRLAEAVAQNPGAMEAVEADAEAADAQDASSAAPPLSFLQRRGLAAAVPGSASGRQVVIDLLRSRGLQLRSAALASLASQLAADPFAKVKQLIQELIERLLKQSTNEANQKGWCDKSTSDAGQKRDYAADEVEELNGRMARLEALRDKLTEELAALAQEIADLQASQTKAESLRASEKAENQKVVAEATTGRDAVLDAIDLLSKFYRASAKATVLSQQSPLEDMPDAGFGVNNSYTGQQGAASGILGMLDVIKSDFGRTVTETEKAEAQAEQDHLEFMTETGKSLAEKTTAETERTKQKDDTTEKLSGDAESLQSQTTLLQSALQELLQLKAACVDTGMSYEDRAARREEEIESLKKAVCILENFAKYGPGATGDC